MEDCRVTNEHHKRCSKCCAIKLASEFYLDRRPGRGLQSWCKECVKSPSQRRRRQAIERSRPIEQKSEWQNKRYERSKESMDDRYIKHLIWRRSGIDTPPDELIGAHRALLKVKRLLKERKA